MSTLHEQSLAYAWLGMFEEARALADECAGEIQDWDVTEAWRVRLAYKSGDFPRVVKLGRRLLAHGKQVITVDEYTALALHHLGESREAASLLLALGENTFSSLQSYLAACFLAVLGDWDEAARHLLESLPGFRKELGKTWLDGDLKGLWRKLAGGGFSMRTAHILVESEFDVLRAWKPERSTVWELDPSNYDRLPLELKAVTRWDGEAQAHVLDYTKAPAFSALSEQFEQWAQREVRTNQDNFDRARRIAWKRVLDAQPGYALDAWNRGDLCAARHHVIWALENEPERIADYSGLTELGPMIDEMSRMLDSDWQFFKKLRRAFRLQQCDPETALEILGSLPAEWRTHPYLEHVRAHCLEAGGNPVEGPACLLRACEQSPADAAPFLNAIAMALRHGWKEVASELMVRAPEAARCYLKWHQTKESLEGAERSCYPPTRDFRGQPDLGGIIVDESKVVRSRTAVATP